MQHVEANAIDQWSCDALHSVGCGIDGTGQYGSGTVAQSTRFVMGVTVLVKRTNKIISMIQLVCAGLPSRAVGR